VFELRPNFSCGQSLEEGVPVNERLLTRVTIYVSKLMENPVEVNLFLTVSSSKFTASHNESI
jgi:hypothetical protein